MQQKKIPMRQCVGCREMKPKKELIRVVRSPEGGISLFGFTLKWPLLAASVIMVAIGTCAGFFVVPMNALLQHRGLRRYPQVRYREQVCP